MLSPLRPILYINMEAIMKFNSDLLKKLTEIYGPTGREYKVAEFIIAEIKDYVDEIEIDTLGNLIAHKKGPGKKVALSAHMDQLGMIIKTIDEKGFMRFGKLGSIKPFNLMDSRVIFENGTEGVIICEKVEDFNKVTHNNLYIDIATLSKEDVLKKVRIGDVAITKSEYYENEECVMTQCLDDRIGCMIVIETIKQNIKSKNDMYYIFTVQEEEGCIGAEVAGYSIHPDLFITFDVACTGDELRGIRTDMKLGGGAGIKVKDAFLMVNYDVVKYLIKLSEDNSIKYQLEVSETGGTDATPVQSVKSGVKSGSITIPTRNIHSRNEIISKEDIINCIELAVSIEKNELGDDFNAKNK